MKVTTGQNNRLMYSKNRKSPSGARRGLTFVGTKRRYGIIIGQTKRRSAKGRYRFRQETQRRQSISSERPDGFNKRNDLTYNEDFKIGFAQGYEDGHFAQIISSLPYRRSNVE